MLPETFDRVIENNRGSLPREFAGMTDVIGTIIRGNPISVSDETGSVMVDPRSGGFQVKPSRSPFGVKFSPNDFMRGGGPSAELTFEFGKNKNRERMEEEIVPEIRVNPMTGDQLIVDERGFTRRVPRGMSPRDVMYAQEEMDMIR